MMVSLFGTKTAGAAVSVNSNGIQTETAML